MNNIILTGNDEDEMKRLKERLAREFKIKDLGHLRYFLRMEILRNKSRIFMSQRKYILDLLCETGFLGCRLVETPMDPNINLGKHEESAFVGKKRYQRLVGKSIYLSHTRPIIAFTLSLVTEFMHSPHDIHLEVMYRILRYLKGTIGRGLFFKNGVEISIKVFTDANWAGDVNDRKSTSGYCTFVWGNLVTWSKE